jgi:hypothetical protein
LVVMAFVIVDDNILAFIIWQRSLHE